jgi:hypothetical protein
MFRENHNDTDFFSERSSYISNRGAEGDNVEALSAVCFSRRLVTLEGNLTARTAQLKSSEEAWPLHQTMRTGVLVMF